MVDPGNKCVAALTVTRDLSLLDLTGPGAMRAGSVAALAKTADRNLSQAWSRYFNKNWRLYGTIDGILYPNAHNDEPAIALYQRAKTALVCPPSNVMRLDNPALRPGLQNIAINNNLVLTP